MHHKIIAKKEKPKSTKGNNKIWIEKEESLGDHFKKVLIDMEASHESSISRVSLPQNKAYLHLENA